MIHATNILVLIVAVVLVGWDIYAMVNHIPGDTISEIVRRSKV